MRGPLKVKPVLAAIGFGESVVDDNGLSNRSIIRSISQL